MNASGGGDQPILLPRYCPGCGRSLEESDQFCPFCGRHVGLYVAMPPPFQAQIPRPVPAGETIRRIGRGVTLLGLASLSILLLVNVITLLWSPMVVLPETTDPTQGNTLFLIIPWSDPLLGLFDVTGWSFAIYHLLLVIAITASFVWMMVRSYDPLHKELSLNRLPEGHSPLWVMGTIFFAILAINYLFAILLALVGYSPRTPDFESQPLWALLHGYASASVWEELVTRVVYIGIPLLLIDLATQKRKSLARYLLGGEFKLGGKELILIGVSASIFALGHIVNWDASKLVTTWIAGLAFGYLFLRLGLYAAIMLHFTVDYLTIPLVISEYSLLVTLMLGLLFLFWGVLGCGYVAVYARRILGFFSSWGSKGRVVPLLPSSAATAPPPRVGQGGPEPRSANTLGNVRKGERPPREGFYSCAKCGNTQAHFEEGKLECTRCGNKE